MSSYVGHHYFQFDARAKDHMVRLNPRVLLFMDNNGGAKQAADLLPNCRVISRIFKAGQPNETDLHREAGATRAWVQARAADHDHDMRVFINSACEPSKDREDDVRRLVAETLLALEWALPRGVRVAAPHGAFYGIRNWRELDPLADFIAKYPDQFLFTCDEYGAGHLWSGASDPSLVGSNEVAHIDPANWRAAPHYWHIGSITTYWKDRKARGKPIPPFAITEGLGTDANSDVQAWRNTLLLADGYDDRRGWKSVVPQWEAWWNNPASPYNRNWPPEIAYAEQIKSVLREIYAPFPEFVGALIYCWGWVDRAWQQFDVSHAFTLQAELEKMQITGGTMPTPIPDTPEVHARLKTLPGTTVRRNIRAETNSDSADIGDLNIGDEVYWHPSPPAPSNGGWVYVRKVVGNISGWISMVAGVTFETIVDVPGDSTEVAQLKQQVATLTTQLATATTANVALAAANDNYRALLSSLRSELAPFSDTMSMAVFKIDSGLESGTVTAPT